MTVTCPAPSPSAAAARASYTSSTRWTSRKWFPEPSVPTWLRPRSSAVSDPDAVSDTALERGVGHGVRVRGAQAAALLRRLEIGGPAELARHRPRRAPRQHLLLLGPGELRDRALGADTGRDRLVERVGDPVEVHPNVVGHERGAQQAHAAVDVEADAAGRDRALLRVDRGHPADREAVAPVDVGHGERVADDPGQVRHVRDLLERRIVAQLRHELLARVDPAGHAHTALARDLPDVVVDPLELHGQTSRMMRAHHPPAVSRSASWW